MSFWRRLTEMTVDPRGPMTLTYRGPGEAHQVHLTFRDAQSGRSVRLRMPRHFGWEPVALQLAHLAGRLARAESERQEIEARSSARLDAAVARHQDRLALRTLLRNRRARDEQADYKVMLVRTRPSFDPGESVEQILEREALAFERLRPV